VNVPLVCIVAALSAAPALDDPQTEYTPAPQFALAIRGQNPPYEDPPPGTVNPPGDPNTFTAPPTVVPYGGYPAPINSSPMMNDPFSAGVPLGGYPQTYAPGASGAKPYRFGWQSRYDFGILPKESTTSMPAGLGGVRITEFDADWEYTTPMMLDWIFSFTQEFDLRGYHGPAANATPAPPLPNTIVPSLPGSVFRFGWDFELATPANGPYSVQFGFNPSLNSDFQSNLSSDAWNWDGRGIIFYRPNPYLMYALGAGFWDRVNDRVVPYAGFVWTPDDRWEYRLVFPEPRISYNIGNYGWFAQYLYVRGEWHIETYEITLPAPGGPKSRVELEDWRILFGARKDFGWVSYFVEAGWVFGREVEYQRLSPGFDISSGFIARLGFRM